MWLRRLAALALAVALVAGAFVVRDRRNGSSASPGTTTPGATSGPATTRRSGPFTLVCALELRSLCETDDVAKLATVRVESAATTSAAFAAATDPRDVADAWLAVHPWPGLSDLARPAAGSTSFAASDVLAHSPVGLAVRVPRGDKLAAACGGTATLTCAGDKGGAAWTTLGGEVAWQVFKPTIADPVTSATGAASLVAAVREQRKDQALTLTELESDLSFTTWLRGFVRPTSGGASPLEQALRTPVYDAVVLPRAEFDTTMAGRTMFAFVSTSAYAAEIVLAASQGSSLPRGLGDAIVARATAASGWQAGAAAGERRDANLVAGMQRAWKENG